MSKRPKKRKSLPIHRIAPTVWRCVRVKAAKRRHATPHRSVQSPEQPIRRRPNCRHARPDGSPMAAARRHPDPAPAMWPAPSHGEHGAYTRASSESRGRAHKTKRRRRPGSPGARTRSDRSRARPARTLQNPPTSREGARARAPAPPHRVLVLLISPRPDLPCTRTRHNFLSQPSQQHHTGV